MRILVGAVMICGSLLTWTSIRWPWLLWIYIPMIVLGLSLTWAFCDWMHHWGERQR